jgi:DNA-directed RNA polymerase specialized sigma24 family protein
VAALLESPAFSYRELAEELAMPQGSIGPVRSRCLACLRRLLRARPDGRGPSENEHDPVSCRPRNPTM